MKNKLLATPSLYLSAGSSHLKKLYVVQPNEIVLIITGKYSRTIGCAFANNTQNLINYGCEDKNTAIKQARIF